MEGNGAEDGTVFFDRSVGLFTFQRHERLSGPDFKRVMRTGRRRVGHCVTLWAYHRPDTPSPPARLGVVVSRRYGGAVQRNLFKRRTRDVFRTHKPWPRGWDFVVAPKTPGPFPPAYTALREDVLNTIRKLV